jgi:hypothetical protein
MVDTLNVLAVLPVNLIVSFVPAPATTFPVMVPEVLPICMTAFPVPKSMAVPPTPVMFPPPQKTLPPEVNWIALPVEEEMAVPDVFTEPVPREIVVALLVIVEPDEVVIAALVPRATALVPVVEIVALAPRLSVTLFEPPETPTVSVPEQVTVCPIVGEFMSQAAIACPGRASESNPIRAVPEKRRERFML